jgi:hypothetical protein
MCGSLIRSALCVYVLLCWYVAEDSGFCVPKTLSTFTWRRITYYVFLDLTFITAVGTWWILCGIDLLCWYLKYTYVGNNVDSIANELEPLVKFKCSKWKDDFGIWILISDCGLISQDGKSQACVSIQKCVCPTLMIMIIYWVVVRICMCLRTCTPSVYEARYVYCNMFTLVCLPHVIFPTINALLTQPFLSYHKIDIFCPVTSYKHTKMGPYWLYCIICM